MSRSTVEPIHQNTRTPRLPWRIEACRISYGERRTRPMNRNLVTLTNAPCQAGRADAIVRYRAMDRTLAPGVVRVQVSSASLARKNLEQIHDFKQSAPDHQTPEGNQPFPNFWQKSCGHPIGRIRCLEVPQPLMVSLPHKRKHPGL